MGMGNICGKLNGAWKTLVGNAAGLGWARGDVIGHDWGNCYAGSEVIATSAKAARIARNSQDLLGVAKSCKTCKILILLF